MKMANPDQEGKEMVVEEVVDIRKLEEDMSGEMANLYRDVIKMVVEEDAANGMMDMSKLANVPELGSNSN